MGFTVATIAREPWSILNRFLRWHLDQGADRIVLYLDDPDDPAIPHLQGEPRIDVRPCTPAYWSAARLSPDARFVRRQRHVLSEAYHELSDGWLEVVDADELMWFRDRPIGDVLDALPADAMSLRVLSAEEVRLPGGAQAFRTPIDRPRVNDIYGADADLLRIRFGLVYHPEGKSFHRAGQSGLNMKLHWAQDADGNRTPGPVMAAADRAYLLHYAAPDYEAWRAKVDWRAGAHGFSQPMKDRLAEIAQSDDPEAGYRALYDRLHSLTEAQAAMLEEAGGLLRDQPPLPEH
ncbi:glycosyltransferase family 2 protein [Hasllibacter sp. MH4015]|uniref:glycosyltransferase family 2 protein n=1 Tax=Hasllibacter sp. MH4015 TaxID=2854029 RepID=UPI001CD26454|nr:glycosyltransferase family 2 protein [Hasllibacter sp. MH4015]